MEIFETPIIGLVSLVIILGAWYGGVRFPGKLPGGLVAIAVGTLIAWLSYAFGWGFGGMNPASVQSSLGNIGFSIPLPAFGHVLFGF